MGHLGGVILMGQRAGTTGRLGSQSDRIPGWGVFGKEMSVGTSRADWPGRLHWLLKPGQEQED